MNLLMLRVLSDVCFEACIAQSGPQQGAGALDRSARRLQICATASSAVPLPGCALFSLEGSS